MRILVPALIALTLAGTSLAQMDAAERARLRAAIAMDAAELDWARLPWLMSYGAGLEQAGQQGRPLLLWVMNGHPFGCT